MNLVKLLSNYRTIPYEKKSEIFKIKLKKVKGNPQSGEIGLLSNQF
jgi:hypothetical protein